MVLVTIIYKLLPGTKIMLHYIVLITVSSASQFAGIIHWISLVILSVFFSEVCIMHGETQLIWMQDSVLLPLMSVGILMIGTGAGT